MVHMKPKRVVIIHNHLFKNAGTTIDYALRNNFESDFIDHRDDELMKRGAEYLGPYLLDNPHIRAISTHHLTLPLPVLKDVLLSQLVMYRHPVERVTSVYAFERKQEQATTPGVIHARKYDLKEYVAWRMNVKVGDTIRNFYISRSLPPRKNKKKPYDSHEFEMACRNLQQVAMVGLVERFDESMVLFEEYLRPYFPEIDLSYVPQNIGQDPQPYQERIASVKKELGDELFSGFLMKNREDLALYELAKARLEESIQRIPGFNYKLEEFRAKCDQMILV